MHYRNDDNWARFLKGVTSYYNTRRNSADKITSQDDPSMRKKLYPGLNKFKFSSFYEKSKHAWRLFYDGKKSSSSFKFNDLVLINTAKSSGKYSQSKGYSSPRARLFRIEAVNTTQKPFTYSLRSLITDQKLKGNVAGHSLIKIEDINSVFFSIAAVLDVNTRKNMIYAKLENYPRYFLVGGSRRGLGWGSYRCRHE